MNIRKLLISLFVALSTMTMAAFAQTQAAETTVAKIKGSVMAQLPDGSTVTVQPGMKLPQGATISTGVDSEAYLVNHGDTTSVVTANSVVSINEVSVTTTNGQVTEQKTLLDLKSGNLVAKLNPAKKSVNNYAVRTPKGVAAARGTVFTVSYKGGNYAIAVVNGVVTITPPAGGGIEGTGIGIEIKAGQATAALAGETFSTAVPLNEAITNPAFAAGGGQDVANLLSLAVATVAVAAENNIGGTTAAELREVADAVISAVPAAAPAIAALVQVSAPTQSAAIIESTKAVAPEQTAVVEQTVRDTPPATTTPPPTTETPPPPPTTTPQPIDPTTVSRPS